MISMQHATYCHSNQHCESSLSVFWEKIWENSAKKKTTVKKFLHSVEIFLTSVKIFSASMKSFFEKVGVS